MKRHPFRLLSVCLIALLAACGGGGTSPPPVPTPAPERLYVSGDSVPNNSIAYFNSPFGANTTIAGTIATAGGGAIAGLAVDATGRVFAADGFKNTLTAYPRPAPPGAPLFVMSLPFTPAKLAFDGAGNLYVADYGGGRIAVLAAPIAGTSAPATLITGLSTPNGLCFDVAANLYVTSFTSSILSVYQPPYTGSPVIVNTGTANSNSCAVDAATQQLIVASGNASLGQILVYDLPLAANAGPAVRIPFNGTAPTALAVDPSGDLFVGVGATAIQVYAPPFTSVSSPLFAIPTVNSIGAMAFGS